MSNADEGNWINDGANFGLEVTFSNELLKITTPDLTKGINYLFSRQISEALIEFDKYYRAFIQVPLPAPKPPRRSRDPATLSRLIAVLDQHQTREAADFGLKNVTNIGGRLVGEIPETKIFIDHLRHQHIPRTRLMIRDDVGYIDVSSSAAGATTDFTAGLR